MKNEKMSKKKLYIILLILILLLTNCTKNKETKFKKKDRAPDSINKLSDNIQDILKNVEKIEKIEDGTYIEKKDKEEDKKELKKEAETENGEANPGGDAEKGGDKEKGGETENSQVENPKDNMDKSEKDKEKDIEEKLEKSWEKIEEKLDDIHKKWNEFEVEGIKKGMTREEADLFRNSLNDLTKSIENKNVMDIYNFAAECFLNLSPIFNMYKDELKGEINQIKYITYKSYLMGMIKEEGKGQKLLADAEENINLIKIRIDEDDEEDEEELEKLEKLKLSILDMKKSLLKESISLNRIKKDVIIRNLEAINN